MGLHKPIYHPLNDCGDHVVVINTSEIALPGDEWTKRVYFHHTGYPGGASWTLAWELHKKDPTMVWRSHSTHFIVFYANCLFSRLCKKPSIVQWKEICNDVTQCKDFICFPTQTFPKRYCRMLQINWNKTEPFRSDWITLMKKRSKITRKLWNIHRTIYWSRLVELFFDL